MPTRKNLTNHYKVKELKERVKEFEKNNQLLEAQRIKQRTEYDLEMMLELVFVKALKITQGTYREKRAKLPDFNALFAT